MIVSITPTYWLLPLVAVVIYLTDAQLIVNDVVDARKSHYFSFHMNDNMKSIGSEQTISDFFTIPEGDWLKSLPVVEQSLTSSTGQTFHSLNVPSAHQTPHIMGDVVEQTSSQRDVDSRPSETRYDMTKVVNLRANDSDTSDLPEVILTVADANSLDGNTQESSEYVSLMPEEFSTRTAVDTDSEIYNTENLIRDDDKEVIDEINFISDIINEIMSTESRDEPSENLASDFHEFPGSDEKDVNPLQILIDNVVSDRDRTHQPTQLNNGVQGQSLFKLLQLISADYNEPINDVIDTLYNAAPDIPEIYEDSLDPVVAHTGELTENGKEMFAGLQDNVQSKFYSLPMEMFKFLASHSGSADVNKIIQSLQEEELKRIQSLIESFPAREREYVFDKTKSLSRFYRDLIRDVFSQMLESGKTLITMNQQPSRSTGGSESSSKANEDKNGTEELKKEVKLKLDVFEFNSGNNSKLISASSVLSSNDQPAPVRSLQRSERSTVDSHVALDQPLRRRERSKDWPQSDVSSMNHKIRNKKLFLTQQFQMMKHEKSLETRQMAGVQNNQILPWGISAQSEAQDLFNTEGINPPLKSPVLGEVGTGNYGNNNTHLNSQDVQIDKMESHNRSIDIVTDSTNQTSGQLETLLLIVSNVSETVKVNQTVTELFNLTDNEDKISESKSKRNLEENVITEGKSNKTNDGNSSIQGLNATVGNFRITSANFSSVTTDVHVVDEKREHADMKTKDEASVESGGFKVNNMSLLRDLKQARSVNETLELAENKTKKVAHDTPGERRKRHTSSQHVDDRIKGSAIGPVPSWVLYVTAKPTTTQASLLWRPSTTSPRTKVREQPTSASVQPTSASLQLQPTVATLQQDIQDQSVVTIKHDSWKSQTSTFKTNEIKQKYGVTQDTGVPESKKNNEQIVKPTSLPLNFVKIEMIDESKTGALPLRTQKFKTEAYIDRYLREKEIADNSPQKRGVLNSYVIRANYQNQNMNRRFGGNSNEPSKSVSNDWALKSGGLNTNRNQADEGAKSVMSYADRFLLSKNQMKSTGRSFVADQIKSTPNPINSHRVPVPPKTAVYDSTITEQIGNSRSQMNSYQVPSQREIFRSQISDQTGSSNQMISNKVLTQNEMYRTDQRSQLHKTTTDVSTRQNHPDVGILPMEPVVVHYQPVITYYTPPIHYSQIPDYLDFAANFDTSGYLEQWASSKKDSSGEQGPVDPDKDQRVSANNDPDTDQRTVSLKDDQDSDQSTVSLKDDQDSDQSTVSLKDDQDLDRLKDFSPGETKVSQEAEDDELTTDQSDTMRSSTDQKLAIYNVDDDPSTLWWNDQRKTPFIDHTVYDGMDSQQGYGNRYQNTKSGYQNTNSRYKNTDSRYQNVNSGNKNTDSRYQNINSGYINKDYGYQNINSGSRNSGKIFNFMRPNKNNRKYSTPISTVTNVHHQNEYYDEPGPYFQQHDGRTVDNIQGLPPQKMIGQYNQQNPPIKTSSEEHDKDEEAILQFIYSKKKMNTEHPGMSNDQEYSSSNYYQTIDSSPDKGKPTGEDKMVDEIVEHYLYTKPKYGHSSKTLG